MEKPNKTVIFFFAIVQLSLYAHSSQLPVRLHRYRGHLVLDNGIVSLELSVPQGLITGIKYHGIRNILLDGREDNRGYWDIAVNGKLDMLRATKYRIIKEEDDQIEVSFVREFDNHSNSSDINRPLNIDKRFIMLRGSSGFYTYAIFERLKGWPALDIDESRVCFKLNQSLFDYMAISDSRQRFMPTAEDRERGQILDYKEAVLLTTPRNKSFKGEVDDKYQYSADIKDNRVHGWISFGHNVGFWIIIPNNEFRIGGPLKQELSSHVGPTALAMFFSRHYAGSLDVKFKEGEAWKKVFGPVFIYLNSGSPRHNPLALWDDAKQQMEKETKKWPYKFPLSEDYPHAHQRGSVGGRLVVFDRYLSKNLVSARFAYVGLANPGEARSWQYENKGYQFWTNADAEGNFEIKNVRPGIYNLFAWVPGIIGDYKFKDIIRVAQGSSIRVGNIVYAPPRTGPTLWEIGIPDRTAGEFYVPDPIPNRQNFLFLNKPQHKFRQYGLWTRYTDLYPDQDLTYTVGVSDYKRDWFYAHLTRKSNNTIVATTWKILFDMEDVKNGSYYTLRVAIAASSRGDLEVRVNDPRYRKRAQFSTGRIGVDNVIGRHGIHGLYELYSFQIGSSQLLKGRNAIYFTQPKSDNQLVGLMYDYIRFEDPH